MAKTKEEMLHYLKLGIDLKADIEIKNEDIDTLRKALEKQIPYRPEPFAPYAGRCKCGAVFWEKSTRICGACGQLLEWSEDNGKSGIHESNAGQIRAASSDSGQRGRASTDNGAETQHGSKRNEPRKEKGL